MTIDISDNNPRASYTVAQGAVQTTFTVPFEFFEDADVSVYLDDVLKTQGSHYTLSASTVTMSVTGATGGSSVVLVRSVALERTTDFVAGQDINRASLNQQLDTIVAQVSDLKDKADRTVHLSNSEVAPSMLLTSDRKGKVLAFNATTGAVEAGPTSNDIATIATNIAEILAADDEAAAAAASATAAASSAAASAASAVDSTNNGAAQVVLSAAQVALANTAKTAAETAETNAETAAALATTNGAAQVVLATDQVALATTQAGLATTNGAAQVTLATAQTSLATTQASNAAGSASTASTQAGISTTKASEASASATAAAASAASITDEETNAAASAAASAGSATASANSAAASAAALDTFDDRYLGSKTANPTLDNDGDALVAGALYFNSTANEMRVYDGGNWIAASSAGAASLILYEYTATNAQTTFSGADDNAASMSYAVGNIQVVLNGVILDPSDFTATSGTSIVLASGAATGDLLNVYAFKSFTVADTVSASAGGTFAGNITVTGSFTSQGIDDNANSTAITIDSSERLKFGTTSNTPASAGVAGIVFGDNTAGTPKVGVASFSSDGAAPVLLTRLNSDGNILGLAKDGSTVGSIGVDSNTRLYFTNSTGAGLFLSDGSQVEPMSNGTRTDDTMSLGGSVYRFRNAYLSGGVYLGGTGSANKLSDYETGTWTPTYSFSGGGTVTTTTNTGKYVKIGSLVQASFKIRSTGISGVSGTLKINGLPFTIASEERSGGSPAFMRNWAVDMPYFRLYPVQNTSHIVMYFNSTGVGTAQVDTTEFSGGSDSNVLEAHVIYQV